MLKVSKAVKILLMATGAVPLLRITTDCDALTPPCCVSGKARLVGDVPRETDPTPTPASGIASRALAPLMLTLMKRTSLRVPRKLGANSTNTVHDAAGIMAPAQVPPTENSAGHAMTFSSSALTSAVLTPERRYRLPV